MSVIIRVITAVIIAVHFWLHRSAQKEVKLHGKEQNYDQDFCRIVDVRYLLWNVLDTYISK